MITLRNLQVRDFKSLREINLNFPKQASILIEGLNESGKSSLFEAIFFALYGEPLVVEEAIATGKGSNESAINYQATETRVNLVVEVEGTEISIERSLKRQGRSTKARMLIKAPGRAEEEVTGQLAVNTRVIQELGSLDKEALLNSCFVEQKKLSKLEELGGQERRKSLEYILNLGKLQSLQEKYKITNEDKEAARQASLRLNLAETQALIPLLENSLQLLRRKLSAVNLHELLEQIEIQLNLSRNLAEEQNNLNQKRRELNEISQQIASLKEQQVKLREVVGIRKELNGLEAEVEGLKNELNQLDHCEQEELPKLLERQKKLDELKDALDRLAIVSNSLVQARTRSEALQAELAEINDKEIRRGELVAEIDNTNLEIQVELDSIAADDRSATAAEAELEKRKSILSEVVSLLNVRDTIQAKKSQAEQLKESLLEEYASIQANLQSAFTEERACELKVESKNKEFLEAQKLYQDNLTYSNETLKRVQRQQDQLREIISFRQEIERTEKDYEGLKAELTRLDEIQNRELPELDSQLESLEQFRLILEELGQITKSQAEIQREIQQSQQEISQINERLGQQRTLSGEIRQTESELGQLTEKIRQDEVTAQEKLQKLEGHISGVGQLSGLLQERHKLETRLGETEQVALAAQNWHTEHEELEAKLQKARDAEADAAKVAQESEAVYTEAKENYQRVREIIALEKWLQGHQSRDNLYQQRGALEFERQNLNAANAQLTTQEKQKNAGLLWILLLVVAIILILAGVGLSVFGYLWAIALIAVGGLLAILAGLQIKKAGGEKAKFFTARQFLTERQLNLTPNEASLSALEGLGSGAGAIIEAENNLKEFGLPLPPGVAEAQGRLAWLGNSSPVLSGPLNLIELAEKTEKEHLALEAARTALHQTSTDTTNLEKEVSSHLLANRSQADINQSLVELRAGLEDLNRQISAKSQEYQLEPSLLKVTLLATELNEDYDQQKAILSSLPARHETVSTREAHLKEKQEKLVEIEQWVKCHDPAEAEGRLKVLELQAQQQHASQLQLEETSYQQQERLSIDPQPGSVQKEQGAVLTRKKQLDHSIAQRPILLQQQQENGLKLEKQRQEEVTRWQPLAAELELYSENLPYYSEMLALQAALSTNYTEADSHLKKIEASSGVVESLRAAKEQAQREKAELSSRVRTFTEQAESHLVAMGKIQEIEFEINDYTGKLAETVTSLNLKASKGLVIPNITTVTSAQNEIDSELKRHRDILAALPARRDHLKTRQGNLDIKKQETGKLLEWLSQHVKATCQSGLAAADNETLGLEQQQAELEGAIQQDAHKIRVAPQAAAVQEEKGRTASQLLQLQKEQEKRPILLQELAAQSKEIETLSERGLFIWKEASLELTCEKVPDSNEIEYQGALVANHLSALDEPGVISQKSGLEREEGRIKTSQENATKTRHQLENKVGETLNNLNLKSAATTESIGNVFPVFNQVTTADKEQLIVEEKDRETEIRAAQQNSRKLAEDLNLGNVILDVPVCKTELQECQHQIELKKRIEKLVKRTRESMVEKVLPTTTLNLCLLLPLLTLDRYRDCIITTDYKLQIWDEQAGRYVAKNIFSGGTRDQFSLALRLSFALATLPQELGTTPGFIFLDEPLSSFDGPRTQALVNLLTTGQIAANFSQIFVISHSQMFDRKAFTHHLTMENGRVAEHDFDREVAQPRELVQI